MCVGGGAVHIRGVFVYDQKGVRTNFIPCWVLEQWVALDGHVSNDRTFSRVFLLFTPTASLQVRLNSAERWRCVQRPLNLFIDALFLLELWPLMCSNNRRLCFPQDVSKTETVLLTSRAN